MADIEAAKLHQEPVIDGEILPSELGDDLRARAAEGQRPAIADIGLLDADRARIACRRAQRRGIAVPHRLGENQAGIGEDRPAIPQIAIQSEARRQIGFHPGRRARRCAQIRHAAIQEIPRPPEVVTPGAEHGVRLNE